MSINLEGIKNSLQQGCKLIVKNVGKLANRSVVVYKQALAHVRNDRFLAGGTIVVANIVFFVTTAKILKFVANRIFGNEEKRLLPKLAFSSGSLIAIMTGFNFALYRGLKSPLNPLQAGIISATTCASCLFLNYLFKRI